MSEQQRRVHLVPPAQQHVDASHIKLARGAALSTFTYTGPDGTTWAIDQRTDAGQPPVGRYDPHAPWSLWPPNSRQAVVVPHLYEIRVWLALHYQALRYPAVDVSRMRFRRGAALATYTYTGPDGAVWAIDQRTDAGQPPVGFYDPHAPWSVWPPDGGEPVVVPYLDACKTWLMVHYRDLLRPAPASTT